MRAGVGWGGVGYFLFYKVSLRHGVDSISRGRRMSSRRNTGVPMICMSLCFSCSAVCFVYMA